MAFGKSNVSELEDIIERCPNGKRMVVDDIEETGTTQALALRILTLVDTGNLYGFFALRRAVHPHLEIPRPRSDLDLPWGSRHTLVRDRIVGGVIDEGSFTTLPGMDSSKVSPDKVKSEWEKAVRLPTELCALMHEVIIGS